MTRSQRERTDDTLGNLSTVAQLLAMVAMSLAALVLLGWAAQLEWAERVLPNMVAMRPTTAMCLLLLGISWFAPRTVSVMSIVASMAIASVTLTGYAFGVRTPLIDLVIDGDSASQPGQITLFTGLCLVLIAGCRLLAFWPDVRPGSFRLLETMALAVMAIAALALLGYAYGVRSLYSVGSLTTMPPHTAIALEALGTASFVSVPRGTASWIFGERDAGARLLRRFLPVTLLVVPALGYVRLTGQRAGLYDTAFGLALMAIGSTVIVTGTAWFAARALSRADRRRESAINALRLINIDLKAQARTHATELEIQNNAAALMRERERIAADLHDLVVQRLFAVALKLQLAATRDPRPEYSAAVEGIDEAIHDLRGSIYALKQSDRTDRWEDTLSVIAHDASALGMEPNLVIQGDIRTVPIEILGELVAVTREAVSNAVRHADAKTLSIQLRITDNEVNLQVRDDGHGLAPDQTSTSGLLNVRTRAEKLGGWCRWEPNEPRGTVLIWHVPLKTAPAIVSSLDRETIHDQVLTVMLDIARDLLSDDADPLPQIARAIKQMVRGDAFSIVVPHDDSTLLIHATEGFDEQDDPAGTFFASEASHSGQVISSGRALRIDDLWELKSVLQPRKLPYGPMLVVPLIGTSRIWGSVNVVRLRGRAPFSQLEVDTATTIASYGMTAMELREHQCPPGLRALPHQAWPVGSLPTRSRSRKPVSAIQERVHAQQRLP